MGVATQSVQSSVQGMMECHSFLMRNGKYCADLLSPLRKKFHCDCISEKEVSHKWHALQQTRWTSACPMADFPAHNPQHILTTSPSKLPPSIVQAPCPATPPDALRQLPPAIIQLPCPPTPPDTDIDASISQAPQHIVAKAPGSEPQFKRARLNSMCDQHNDCLQCQGGQPLQCEDEGATMPEAEQNSFMLALSRAMQSLGECFESVHSVMIRLEQWELLKAIQGRSDLVHECLSQKHAGEPGCWKRSTALKTITRVCQASEATPLLKATIAHLEKWRAFKSTDHVHGILLEFSESWNCVGGFRSNNWYKWSNGKSCRNSQTPG